MLSRCDSTHSTVRTKAQPTTSSVPWYFLTSYFVSFTVCLEHLRSLGSPKKAVRCIYDKVPAHALNVSCLVKIAPAILGDLRTVPMTCSIVSDLNERTKLRHEMETNHIRRAITWSAP